MKRCYTGYVLKNDKDQFGMHDILASFTSYSETDSAKKATEYIRAKKLQNECYVITENTTDKYCTIEEE